MSIENLLRDEIEDEFQHLSKMEVGTDSYKTAIDGLTKLMDRAIEMDKVERELREKVESRKIENELRQKQLNDERKDRLVKNILTGVSIGVPAVLTAWGTLASFAFEKECSVTTLIGKGFINKLLPKK